MELGVGHGRVTTHQGRGSKDTPSKQQLAKVSNSLVQNHLQLCPTFALLHYWPCRIGSLLSLAFQARSSLPCQAGIPEQSGSYSQDTRRWWPPSCWTWSKLKLFFDSGCFNQLPMLVTTTLQKSMGFKTCFCCLQTLFWQELLKALIDWWYQQPTSQTIKLWKVFGQEILSFLLTLWFGFETSKFLPSKPLRVWKKVMLNPYVNTPCTVDLDRGHFSALLRTSGRNQKNLNRHFSTLMDSSN